MFALESRLMLPFHCVSTLGMFWCSSNPHLILQEEVLAWLHAHDMAFEITYDEPDETDECEECDHFIAFLNHYDAIAFKLRWV